METKERYFLALVENKGRLNEVDLGEVLGLDEPETRKVLARLLAEHRIFFESQGACAYSTSCKGDGS